MIAPLFDLDPWLIPVVCVGLALITIAYSSAGGLRAVVATDALTGRPVQLTPAHPDYIDYYNRPWARNWEKWFEAGLKRPAEESPVDVFGGR